MWIGKLSCFSLVLKTCYCQMRRALQGQKPTALFLQALKQTKNHKKLLCYNKYTSFLLSQALRYLICGEMISKGSSIFYRGQ